MDFAFAFPLLYFFTNRTDCESLSRICFSFLLSFMGWNYQFFTVCGAKDREEAIIVLFAAQLQYQLSATTPPQIWAQAVTLSLAKCFSGVSASIRQPFRILFATQHLRSVFNSIEVCYWNQGEATLQCDLNCWFQLCLVTLFPFLE